MIFSRARAVADNAGLVHQYAGARLATAADASAELMQLCQSHAFRILDDHECSVRDVDTDFDDRRCNQQLQLACLECRHHFGFLGRGEPSVHESHWSFSGKVSCIAAWVASAVWSCSVSDSSMSGQTQ